MLKLKEKYRKKFPPNFFAKYKWNLEIKNVQELNLKKNQTMDMSNKPK
jgi:hypothetical protein